MVNIPPGDLLFLVLSVAAAPIGAVWLIRERRSRPPERRADPASSTGAPGQ